jgi:hypothetical protein
VRVDLTIGTAGEQGLQEDDVAAGAHQELGGGEARAGIADGGRRRGDAVRRRDAGGVAVELADGAQIEDALERDPALRRRMRVDAGRPRLFTTAQRMGAGLGNACANNRRLLRSPVCSSAARASSWRSMPCLKLTAAMCASAAAGNEPQDAASTRSPLPTERTLSCVTPKLPFCRNDPALLNRPGGPPLR